MPLQVSCLWGGGAAEEVTVSPLVRSFLEGVNRTRPVPLGRGGSVPCCSVSGKVTFPTFECGGPRRLEIRRALGPSGAEGQPMCSALPPTSGSSSRSIVWELQPRAGGPASGGQDSAGRIGPAPSGRGRCPAARGHLKCPPSPRLPWEGMCALMAGRAAAAPRGPWGPWLCLLVVLALDVLRGQ